MLNFLNAVWRTRSQFKDESQLVPFLMFLSCTYERALFLVVGRPADRSNAIIRLCLYRTELAQAKRENETYLEAVKKAKEAKSIVERKRKRGDAVEEVTAESQFATARKKFRQRKVHGDAPLS